MIRVQPEDFDTGAELDTLMAGGASTGAIVTFTGLVRGLDGDKPIDGLLIEHYPGMTEAELVRLEAEARQRWPLTASLIIHRTGALVPGDRIVLVAAASLHREAAFQAAAFMMDRLKTEAPFWKKERRGGEERWIEAHGADDDAARRWAAMPEKPSARRRTARLKRRPSTSREEAR